MASSGLPYPGQFLVISFLQQQSDQWSSSEHSVPHSGEQAGFFPAVIFATSGKQSKRLSGLIAEGLQDKDIAHILLPLTLTLLAPC